MIGLRVRIRNWLGAKFWRIGLFFKQWRWHIGVGAAERICRGNKYGDHTKSWPARQPLGGPCLCSRARRAFDYIPF